MTKKREKEKKERHHDDLRYSCDLQKKGEASYAEICCTCNKLNKKCTFEIVAGKRGICIAV